MNTAVSKKDRFLEIKDFFKTFDFDNPWPQTFSIDKCGKVFNLRTFVDSHIATLESNSGKATFLPYYIRLEYVYEQLKKS